MIGARVHAAAGRDGRCAPYMTGVTSTRIWTHYSARRAQFCGHALPDGLRKNQRLPEPHPDAEHQGRQGRARRSASREEILEMGTSSRGRLRRAPPRCARALFAFGQSACAERGLILVDTKYELGKRPDGDIVVIDEIHTPDSSRFWYADDYDASASRRARTRELDKEYVRRWLAERATRATARRRHPRRRARRGGAPLHRGVRADHRQPFVPDIEEPQARIAATWPLAPVRTPGRRTINVAGQRCLRSTTAGNQAGVCSARSSVPAATPGLVRILGGRPRRSASRPSVASA